MTIGFSILKVKTKSNHHERPFLANNARSGSQNQCAGSKCAKNANGETGFAIFGSGGSKPARKN
jgi:hypothetical protein